MWPFNKKVVEERASYTDALVAAIISSASGNARTDFRHLGATQIAAGLWGRTLASADLTPDSAPIRALSPGVLYDVGASLVTEGESCYVIEIVGNRVILIRACSWDISGSSNNPEQWRYRLEIPTPGGSYTRFAVGAEVFHPRIHTNASEPHKGISPIVAGAITARFASALETQLTEETEAPSGRVLPAPLDSIGTEALAQLRADLKNMRGRTSIVQSMAAAWGEGRSSAPSDWKPQRIGADPPEILQLLRRDASNSLLSACGIPESLYNEGGDSTGRREAFRQFLHSTIAPIGRIVASEIDLKLQPGAAFTFERLFASDVQGRARAFQSLVGGGMDITAAAGATGILTTD